MKSKQHKSESDSPEDKQDVSVPRPKSTVADICQVIIQGFLLAGAFYGICIYEGQLTQMRKANALMKDSTDAATKAAKAAEDSVILARDMNRLDQRAWVAVAQISGPLQAGEPFVTRIRFKNSGKTFARNAQVRVKIDITNKDAFPDFDTLFDTPKDGKEIGVMILAPNAEYESVTEPFELSPFTQEQIDNIRDNQALFVFGRIDYADVFDRGHWTTFCYRYGFPSGEYGYCENHNDADNRSGD